MDWDSSEMFVPGKNSTIKNFTINFLHLGKFKGKNERRKIKANLRCITLNFLFSNLDVR